MAASGSPSKTRARFVRDAWLAAAAVAALILTLAYAGAFDRLEAITYDLRVRSAADPARADPSIVIIDVDNASFDALTEQLGRWPWTRRVWTTTLRYVSKGKPRVVAFDIIFAGATENQPEIDAQLAAAIEAAANVVTSFNFSRASVDRSDQEAEARKLKVLEREARPAGEGYLLDRAQYTANVPLEEIGAAAAGLGCINSVPDADATLRRTPPAFRFGERTYPSFALRTAELAAGGATLPQVPLDGQGNLLLLWHGPAADPDGKGPARAAYRRIPIWQIVCSIYPDQCPPEVERFSSDFFNNKIVIVGASAAGSYDVRPTPFAEQDPGFFVHATAIDNLLRGDGIRLSPRWLLPLAVALLVAVGTMLSIRIASGLWGAAAAVGVLALWTLAAWLAFSRGHLWLPLIAPVAALALSYISASTIRYATVGRELRRTRGTLDRYISPQLVDYVLENLETVQLGGQKRELTILFSDVRNFTTLTEKSDPTELITLLNEYLEAMTEIIFKHDGVVDKFIGDGIMAYWGAFTPGKNHALLASRASLEMLERLEELNRNWAAQGRNSIAIGIGLNTGEVVFGNVGSGRKVEFTVIGDPVNLAARLEGQNKDFGTSIIISEFTRERLGDLARVRPLGGVKVKGKTVETQIYELQGLAPEAAAAD